jgi:predicted RNA methylase
VSTATSEELARRVGFVPGSQEVSCGIHAVLERGFAGTGVPAVGIWARVPHYASPMPYPAASLALLESAAELGGLDLDLSALARAAEETRQRLDMLVSANPQFGALVQQLEAQADAADAAEEQQHGGAFTDIPSGDEIAAEIERFFREQE